MPEPSPRTIRVQPELVPPILRGRLSVPFRLWVVCRAIDPEGSGWITVGQLREAWHQSTANIRAVLKRGEGLFWNLEGRPGNEQRIQLRGLANVCVSLGVTSLNQRPRLLEFDVVQSLRKFNASLYAVWVSVKEEGRTIARPTLKRILNRTRQALRSWEKAASVEVTKNVARARVVEAEDWQSIPTPWKEADESEAEKGVPELKPGFWREGEFIYWQLPSTYHAEFPVAGRPSKARRKVKKALDNASGVSYHRMYWRDEQACFRAISKGDAAENAYLHTDEVFGARGYHVWDHVHSEAQRTWAMEQIHAMERGET